MKTFLLQLKSILLFPILFLLLMAMSMAGMAQTVTLDQADLDYAPGETVGITGNGWQPGETVTLTVSNLTNPDVYCGTTDPHQSWTVVADGSGNFSASWFVYDCELGANLLLTAESATGFTFELFFTDASNKITQIGFNTVNQPASFTVGVPNVASRPLRVQSQNSAGTAEAVTGIGTITFLITSSSATGRFDLSNAGSFTLTSITLTITGAENTPDFYYLDTTPGTVTFTATVTAKGGNGGSIPTILVGSFTTLSKAVYSAGNTAPVLDVVGNKTVNELSELSFTATAIDIDYPTQTLTYSIIGAPAGASINPTTGVFSWTPTEAQGAGSYPFTVKVTDNGTPALSDEELITVTVAEVNVAPILASIGAQAVDEQATLNFTATATDQDVPAQTLTFSLDAASLAAGMTINGSTGAFSWTPTEAQGGAVYPVTVTVTDNGTNLANLYDNETFDITVAEVNVAPILASIGNKTIPWGNLLTFTATATDQDRPNQTLTYSLVGAPIGASINVSSGIFTWTPTEAQALVQGSYSFIVKVTDDGQNPANLSDEESITVTVTKRITTLTYNGDETKQYSDEISLSATLKDVSGGTPGTGVSGKTITFTIGGQSTTAVTNGSGNASTTLILTQAPCGSYNIITSFTEDGSYLGSTDIDALTYQKENAVVEYSGPEFLGCPTCSTIQVLLSASINDIIDGYPGDITKAKVRFLIDDTPLSGGWITPGLVTPGDFTKGTVTKLWDAPVPTSGYNTFTIRVEVASDASNCSYYIGSTSSVLTVYRTTLNEFITGGGHIITYDSKGSYLSESGQKINFGFNVKWNKSVKNLQGNLNLIYRNNGKVYQVKSTAMSSLSVVSTNPCSPKATFVSKCNLNDITNPNAPINIIGGGGSDLQVTFTDNGEAGTSDMIGVTFYSGTTLVFSSSWPVNKTAEMFLDGGNLVVHNGQTCNASSNSKVVIASSKNPSIVGDLVTFTATITGSGTTAPSGFVTFFDGSIAITSAIPLSGGKASYVTSALLLGSHYITAMYSGDTKFNSSAADLVQVVSGTKVANIAALVPHADVTVEPTLNAYPNPFTERLNIEFSSATDTQAKLEIYSITGVKLETLWDAPVEGGVLYKVEYLPKLVGSQMVIYNLTMNGETRVGKLIYQSRR